MTPEQELIQKLGEMESKATPGPVKVVGRAFDTKERWPLDTATASRADANGRRGIAFYRDDDASQANAHYDAQLRNAAPLLLAWAKEAQAWRAVYDGIEVVTGDPVADYPGQQAKHDRNCDAAESARADSDAAYSALMSQTNPKS